ncbi:hypothetical protein CGG98_22410 [Vibrio parahaemolyticus]|nr:hypothetical protein CGG98_22410 [Vibrio parahaemolyticus]
MAFLVWVKFSVYGVQFECRGSVAHTLIGRYVYLYFNGLSILGFSSLSLWQFVPSRLSKSTLSA